MENKESEIDELREECAALRRGFDAVRQMQEAMGSVVQVLARELITDRDQSIEVVKAHPITHNLAARLWRPPRYQRRRPSAYGQQVPRERQRLSCCQKVSFRNALEV